MLLTGVDLSADVLRMLPMASEADAGSCSDGDDDDNSCVSPSINMLRLRIIVTSASREFLMVIIVFFLSLSSACLLLRHNTTRRYLIIISRLLKMAINSASTQKNYVRRAEECCARARGEQDSRGDLMRFHRYIFRDEVFFSERHLHLDFYAGIMKKVKLLFTQSICRLYMLCARDLLLSFALARGSS